MNYNSTAIKEILNLTDNDCEVTDFRIEGHTKYVTIEKTKTVCYCPICGSKLHSKGRLIRHPNNPVLQDGYDLDITLIGRRWNCSNKSCNYSYTDQYSFIEPGKKNTKIVPLMIINDMKDIHLTCRQVAARYNVSDTYVHEIFEEYVNLPRLSLTEIISIDEVYLNIGPKQKYAVVIMDFVTGEILDIVPSRLQAQMHNYWMSIPKKERDGVKYIVSDMYNPYINYASTYLKNAVSIVDSFHVIKWILSYINRYINEVKKKYQERDRKELEERNYRNNHDFETQKTSREVYILNNAKWVLLMNPNNITYLPRHYNRFLNQYLDTYDWTRMFLDLDPKFSRILELKQIYENFNGNYINDLDEASKRLDEIIDIYKNCEINFFNSFSNLLLRYHKEIINSFTYVSGDSHTKYGERLRRLSNGPMEGFNNIPSSLRSNSRGIDNFEFARNRILWSQREYTPIQGVPKKKNK